MSKNQKSGRKVQKNALRVVSLDDLKADQSYQRPENDRAPRKMAENYDPVAFGIPLVGEREDGSLWIVDGQQRIAALRLRVKNKVTANAQKWVRVEIFKSEGPEHEAAVFKKINKDRTQLKPLQLFNAMLVAGDQHVWKIKELVEKHGFKIPKSNGRPGGARTTDENRAMYVSAVNQLSKILARGGEKSLEFVLSVVKEVWDTDPLRTKSEILGGLWQFWIRHKGVVDLERLVPRLNSTKPQKILYSAGMGVSNAEGNVADVIERVYRKRLAKS
jgi:hypothetical protein